MAMNEAFKVVADYKADELELYEAINEAKAMLDDDQKYEIIKAASRGARIEAGGTILYPGATSGSLLLTRSKTAWDKDGEKLKAKLEKVYSKITIKDHTSRGWVTDRVVTPNGDSKINESKAPLDHMLKAFVKGDLEAAAAHLRECMKGKMKKRVKKLAGLPK